MIIEYREVLTDPFSHWLDEIVFQVERLIIHEPYESPSGYGDSGIPHHSRRFHVDHARGFLPW